MATTRLVTSPRHLLPSIASLQCLTGRDTYSTSTYQSNHYNIIISGGGMVGFAMACLLGKSPRLKGQKIALIERSPSKLWSLPSEYGNRVCALSEHTRQVFLKLGVWDHIMSLRAQPVKKMQVWEGCSEAMVTFDQNDLDESVAHIVENDVILEAIKKEVPSNVEVLYDCSVGSYNLSPNLNDKAEVLLSSGEKFSTDLLIGADGAKSLVRETMNSKFVNWEYDQMGIVATLHLAEESDNFTAWQRFLPTGPIALLPLNHSRSSLVWSTTKDQARCLMSMTEEDFVDALNSALWDESSINKTVKDVHELWLNAIPRRRTVIRQLPPSISKIAVGSRASFPLGLGHAVHYVAPRVALIGDSAHRVHPMAGQGVNLGFGDVDCLTKTIENSILLGRDFGDEKELHKYETERQGHNVSIMSTTEGLYRMFSTTSTPIVLMRLVGLTAVDSFGFIKNRMIAHANR